ncbi:hypothetical protein DF033_36980 [Burkholderia cenocepacia]|nr:hypothetical protein DF033_36980 [Burkholderia cenocepacia]
MVFIVQDPKTHPPTVPWFHTDDIVGRFKRCGIRLDLDGRSWNNHRLPTNRINSHINRSDIH